MTHKELYEQISALKKEIAEAMEILTPGSLVNGLGEEIPTTLKERATYTVMALDAEASAVNHVCDERNEILDAIMWYIRNEKDWTDPKKNADRLEQMTTEEIYNLYPRNNNE